MRDRDAATDGACDRPCDDAKAHTTQEIDRWKE